MKLFPLVAVLALTACDGCPPAPPSPPAPLLDAASPPSPVAPEAAPPAVDASADVDASAPVVDAARKPDAAPLDACGRACVVLQSLGCPEARPTPKGENCHDLCVAVESFPGVSLHPGAILSCSTVACVRKAGVACAK